MSQPVNSALSAIPAAERRFGFFDHLTLWGSLGVGLLVIQAGTFLVPALSFAQALSAIVLGSLVGVALLAWVGRLGAQSGLASAGLIHGALGSRLAVLPVSANVLQLIGWAVFEIVVLRDGINAITRQQLGVEAPLAATLLVGAILLALLSLSMVGIVRKLVRHIGLPLMLLALGWLTWQFLGEANRTGWDVLFARPGAGGMGFGAAVDLAIAMPISWLPLVADYTRYGRSGRGAAGGIVVGYLLANTWCFSLGVLIATLHPGGDMMATILLASGGAIALALVLCDEVDNAYGDLYSASVSTHSLAPRLALRRLGPALAVLATVLAAILPIHDYEGFLLLIGSVFVPLFGVVIAHHGLTPKQPDGRAVAWPALVAWLAGIAVYQLVSRNAGDVGASLPALATAFCIQLALSGVAARRLQVA
ncbi:cytosine permease [Chitinolyticbacter albus]|uniref:cytosine permease n=1 Tax=Chitinolyticbacter albus TaxID=2961951 RepID=UPI00210D2D0F|nr:cytosine permease [Chitinolyticbacter albus]